jgi:rhodanese-related sulfurtransferase
LTQRIDRRGLVDLLDQSDALLVEVLPPGAYEALHLTGAINIPLADLDESAIGELDPDRPIVLYCYDHV